MSTATMTDIELQQAVLEELRWTSNANAAHIGVAVKDGIVTLGGFVSSHDEKYAAEEAAKRVHGITAIVSEIEVQLPGSLKRTDEDLATEAVRVLRANVSVPADKIKVTVSQGWVKLEGEVEWQHQKQAAESAVRDLFGVRWLTNLITVKPRLEPTDLKAKIEDAFKHSAEMDARNITVTVEDGKVTLRGTVRSLSEKEAADRVAWSAPGVSQVDNQINVTP